MRARDNNELARQLTRDVARLASSHNRRAWTPAAPPRPETAAEPAFGRPAELARSAPAPEASGLSHMERRGLFVALAAGTRRCLGRDPTATELAHLVNTVSKARQIVAWEKATLRGAEVHWTGTDWSFEASPEPSEGSIPRVA